MNLAKRRRTGLRLPAGGHSIRTRMMIWNMLTLAALLVMLGLVVRAMVRSIMLASVDRDLATRAHRIADRPPPFIGLGPQQMPEGRPDEPPGPPGPGPSDPGPGLGDPERDPEGLGVPADQSRRSGELAPTPGAGRHDGPPGGGGRPPGPPPLPPAAGPYRPRILDLQGHVLRPLGVTAPWDAGAASRALRGRMVYSTASRNGQPMRVCSLAIRDRMTGIVSGVVQTAYPLADVDRAIAGLSVALLALLPVALACAAAGGALLTSRALQPVRQITQAAGRIGAHDLSQRLPVAGKDEFWELAATFNGMLERLDLAFGERERLMKELEALVEQQRRFTADASHELRTPLTVIKANTTLFLGSERPASEYQQSLRDIDAAADTMSRLVRDLLLLARSDAGQLARDPVPLPICEVVERAVCLLPTEGRAPVTVAAPGAPLWAIGNSDEILRLFTNLLENAARHTPPDGAITVTIEQMGGEVAVSVTDTGPGIAPEHLPHLGERFYRVDSSRSRPDGGAGLGLSICKSIAAAHGGRLELTSAVGHGTTARVVLPLADPGGQENAQETEANGGEG